ncbi:hypothetical protein D3C84_1021180 [compost metagenome]
MIVLKQRRHIKHGAFVAKNGGTDPVEREGDRVVCSPLGRDDLVCGIPCAGENSLLRLLVERNAGSGNIRQAPYRKLGISVLADNMGMYAARVDAQLFADQITEARCRAAFPNRQPG